MTESVRTPQELAQARLDAANERREAIKRELAAEQILQAAIDVEAITELEAVEGFNRVIAIDLGAVWKPGVGAPTRVAFTVPTESDGLCQRFIETINKHKEGSRERITAQNALAIECWRYPEKGSDGYKAARELAALVLSNAALQIVHAAEGRAQEQGKD
jgi:hypothetical protein